MARRANEGRHSHKLPQNAVELSRITNN